MPLDVISTSAGRRPAAGLAASSAATDPWHEPGSVHATDGPERTRATSTSVAEAYAFCARLAKSHYENFTIASWLMPRRMRPHMYAIYAYARMADDFADEDRDLPRLDEWERELDRCLAGSASHPVFLALADTVRRYDIPSAPFKDLLVAFRSDVNFRGFETLDELLGYARYSANPVGRLVLYLFGHREAEHQRLSDLICTGLQLANFWQDVAVDLDKGRIYLPRADMKKFGVTADDLRRRVPAPTFVELMRYETGVARRMLREGAALHGLVDRRLARDVLMFAGGGLAILDAIERAGYDVFNRRPRLSRLDYLKLGWNALCGRLGD